jgi:hypothetical protein
MKNRCEFLGLPIVLLALFPAVVPAQAKKPAPSWPRLPAPAKNTGGIFAGVSQKLAETTMSRLLNDQLPLKLDANAIYPVVDVLPGGPFMPRPLSLTKAELQQPLPPGDYTVRVLAFCTEYSVHRPGTGIAYRLGPLQGRAAGAIGELLWRGTIEKNKPPQQLQAVSWAIQSGLRYAQLPKSYQAVIDEIIPDYKTQLNGDFMQSLEDSYAAYAKAAHLAPLEQILAKMGKPGELALSARRQRAALLRQNTSDQIREQTLFAGQESGIYTPVKSEEGPWTEKIPGLAYIRFKIIGGNLAANNLMEIRILPRGGVLANDAPGPHLVKARFAADAIRDHLPEFSAAPTPSLPTPEDLMQNSIGCAVGLGAQCLVPVGVVSDKICGVDTTFSGGKVWPSPRGVPLQVTTGVTGSQGGQVKESNGITISVYPPPECREVHFVQFVATEKIVNGVVQHGLVYTKNPNAPAGDFTYDSNNCVTGWKNDNTDLVPHTLTNDLNNPAWGVDANATSQNPYPFYDTGKGAGACTCNTGQTGGGCNGRPSLTMLDAPRPVNSGVCAKGAPTGVSDTSFATYAVCKTANGWKILGQVKWNRSTQTGYGTPTISGTVDPNTLNQVCNAENITCPGFSGGVSVQQILGCSNQVTTPQLCPAM